MALTVGVIGPEDLVPKVVAVGGSSGADRLVPLPYRHEDETLDVVARAQADVDALLFTGVVPHTLATAAGLLDRPAMYVPYNGATLLRALVELLRLGHDVSRISIDTLRRSEVMETLTEAKLPTEHVHVLPYRPGLTSQDLAEFHLTARDKKQTRVALTCLGSAFHLLDHEMHAVRLAPSRHSIRSTLQALVLATAGAHSGDAQVALGIVDLPAADSELAADLRVLGGSLADLPHGERLVVTTRGVLEEVSEKFTRLPFLSDLAARHGAAHVGFGLGRTAAEAESLARRAVNRARSVGPVAGVVSMTDDVDIVIDAERSSGTAVPGPESTVMLARRVGLNATTLDRLRELAAQDADEGITALRVAEHLDVQQRTARRILKRLERAGVAVPTGSRQEGQTGRPPIVYRVRL
ncbi:helix-turn-helix domain-containing protein [Streptomyces sp. NBC_01481]|uniref:helix-turn-helix domain-containing protein n=1 Tax=Streptomyces sp. NBC_01481 TaxID=2975869 RepID=UPI00225A74B9|nr:helix-turn-helix domain-containing protein [Streptomyces sp. NBC_01481]MCX4586974.1 helix-turn-helix domain-containing protein [Streptomyces sp. NBC_01481]